MEYHLAEVVLRAVSWLDEVIESGVEEHELGPCCMRVAHYLAIKHSAIRAVVEKGMELLIELSLTVVTLDPNDAAAKLVGNEYFPVHMRLPA